MIEEALTAMCLLLETAEVLPVPIESWDLASRHALHTLQKHGVAHGRNQSPLAAENVRGASPHSVPSPFINVPIFTGVLVGMGLHHAGPEFEADEADAQIGGARRGVALGTGA